MAGAPKGNSNAARGKMAKNALNRALAVRSGEDINQMPESFKALVEIWDKQITQALDGDNQSAAMIIDRMDGKAKQQTELSGKVEIEAYELSETERSARIAALLDGARVRRDGQSADDGAEVDAS